MARSLRENRLMFSGSAKTQLYRGRTYTLSFEKRDEIAANPTLGSPRGSTIHSFTREETG